MIELCKAVRPSGRDRCSLGEWSEVCRTVERRFAWIAPMDPVSPSPKYERIPSYRYTESSPVMEMANRAKPRYFPTLRSKTIPVPLEMSIAPI